ncbi:unnamed protein product [Periconia digitata]|uniref:Uncharacterized protein n=1 Tax=Periconia digitata TaxID=1303443 RepID=A0A9W4UG86_9PLEO|nr:unnamed protein product [Periconia digitata]
MTMAKLASAFSKMEVAQVGGRYASLDQDPSTTLYPHSHSTRPHRYLKSIRRTGFDVDNHPSSHDINQHPHPIHSITLQNFPLTLKPTNLHPTIKMQFTITAIVAFAAAAMAAPVLEDRQAGLCTGGGQAQCCATDVLNLADLDCATPPTTPTDVNSFIDICAEGGQQAKCCVLPILGQALFCADVNPTAEAPAPSAA